ncbi:hypothetical protein LZ32DRAFT_611604 [Colletotrichum eremochloae]|nr:hypothetical protein LZ32DRAFT_611604 [Colletotrichum eremochloae]
MRGLTVIISLLSYSLLASAQACTANKQCVAGDCLTIECCDPNVSAATNGHGQCCCDPF